MQALNDVKQPQQVQRKTKSDCTQVTAEELDKNNHEDQVFRGMSSCLLVIMYETTWIFKTVGKSYLAVKKVFICIMKSRNIPRNHSMHSNVSVTCIRGASEKFLNDLKFPNLRLYYHNFNDLLAQQLKGLTVYHHISRTQRQ